MLADSERKSNRGNIVTAENFGKGRTGCNLLTYGLPSVGDGISCNTEEKKLFLYQLLYKKGMGRAGSCLHNIMPRRIKPDIFQGYLHAGEEFRKLLVVF